MFPLAMPLQWIVRAPLVFDSVGHGMYDVGNSTTLLTIDECEITGTPPLKFRDQGVIIDTCYA